MSYNRTPKSESILIQESTKPNLKNLKSEMKNSAMLIKIVLGLLLFLCLLDMPYGYFQFGRFCSFIGFGILAYNAKEKDQPTQVLIYGSLALPFRPFIKIALGRQIWNFVDVIVGLGLSFTIIKNKK